MHLPANAGAVRNALALLDAERPEIVLLTGDIVESYDALDDLIAFARRARGTVGTYAVMGNWERSGGIDADHGAQGLRGGRRAVPLQRDGAAAGWGRRGSASWGWMTM